MSAVLVNDGVFQFGDPILIKLIQDSNILAVLFILVISHPDKSIFDKEEQLVNTAPKSVIFDGKFPGT